MSEEKMRLLVVDDNRDSATTLGYLLEMSGYEVQMCFDGESALAAIGQFRPDACVLDINMPGMDGYELARLIRERDPDHVPVLATFTAYEDYNHVSQAADAGFDLYFAKPTDYREVAEQVESAVRKQAAEREASCATEQTTDEPVAELDEHVDTKLGAGSSALSA